MLVYLQHYDKLSQVVFQTEAGQAKAFSSSWWDITSSPGL